MKRCIPHLVLLLIALSTLVNADDKIAWYGKLEDGLRAARVTGRPIMLISAAVQCKGVSGIY